MCVRYLSKTFYIKYVASGIGDCFAKETFCIGAECSIDTFVIPIGIDKGALNAKLLQRYAKQVECATVNSIGSNEMITSLTDVENSIKTCSLPTTSQYCTDTALEGCYLLCNSIICGIGKAGVEIATVL